ncbi:MAG: hydroxysqualene dehydroxylase HpnE [Candidatus Kapaibacterium sp.]
MNRPIILGGGVAGIAAAMELADAGCKPILIESRPYLGGRVRSFVHRETKEEIDNGRHLLMGCYHTTLNLLNRLGTRHHIFLQPALRVEFRDSDGSSDILSAPPWLPSPLNVLVGMMGLRKLSLRERLSLIRVGLQAKRKVPDEGETVTEYLLRLGQSSRVQERLWNPLVIATLNTKPEEASARLFVEVLRLAFLSSGDDSKLAFSHVGLSQLLSPAQEYIVSRGGDVLLGCFASHVSRDGEGWHVGLRDGRTFDTPTLLSALPWHEFSTLFDKNDQGTSPPRHNPIISLYLWFDSVGDELPDFSAMLGTSVEWIFNRRKILGNAEGETSALIECVISAADDICRMENSRIAAVVEGELRRAFPSLRSARLSAVQVIKEKRATFAATPFVQAMRPKPGYYSDGLFIAGDWTATGLPGTIEGAARSGVAAAQSLQRGE